MRQTKERRVYIKNEDDTWQILEKCRVISSQLTFLLKSVVNLLQFTAVHTFVIFHTGAIVGLTYEQSD